MRDCLGYQRNQPTPAEKRSAVKLEREADQERSQGGIVEYFDLRSG
jgi:hypothetical protein